MDQGTDAFHGAAFAIGYLGGMDERRTFQADVDERRLHPRQYPYHPPLVDIADDAAPLGAFDMHFLQDAVFHHRHARLHRRNIDQDLFAHASTVLISAR